jgi:hypothetical protein
MISLLSSTFFVCNFIIEGFARTYLLVFVRIVQLLGSLLGPTVFFLRTVSWDPGRFGYLSKMSSEVTARLTASISHTFILRMCSANYNNDCLQRCSSELCSIIALTSLTCHYNWRSWPAHLLTMLLGDLRTRKVMGSWSCQVARARCRKLLQVHTPSLRSVSGTTDQSILANSREESRNCSVLFVSLCRTVRSGTVTPYLQPANSYSARNSQQNLLV